MTLFTDRAGNMETAAVEIAADFAGAPIRTQIVAKEKRKTMAKATAIENHRYPYFQLSEKVVLTEGAAIASAILRKSDSARAQALLGGESTFAQAKVDQLVMMAANIAPKISTIEATVFGSKKDVDGAHMAAVKALKESCKVLDTMLADQVWMAGKALTFADIYMFTTLAPAFQLTLDAGCRKNAMPNLNKWFTKMSRLPVVVNRLGFIRPCEKAMVPPKK